jgi:glycosyltransferase involved in cell wall biosynthesis
VSRSLSLVLPVRNAELTLTEDLHQVIEILNDLTERFEVLLVDDGSTDHTLDVARDLSRTYPQIRVATPPPADDKAGRDSFWRETTGDVVFVQMQHDVLRPSVLRRLWALGSQPETAAVPPSPAAIPVPRDPRRRLPGAPLPVTELEGIRMICRRRPR